MPHTLILDGFMGRPWRWEKLRRDVERRVGSASIFRYDWTGRFTLQELGQRLADEKKKLTERYKSDGLPEPKLKTMDEVSI